MSMSVSDDHPVKLAQIEGVLNVLNVQLEHVTERLATVQDAQREQSRTLLTVANTQAAMSSHSQEMERLSQAVSQLDNKFDAWKNAHEDDNSLVAGDVTALKTSHESSDKSTRRTIAACTLLLSVIFGMFSWFLNDKIDYMREADARLEKAHETDAAIMAHRLELIEAGMKQRP
jgi:hypothetical protein